MKKMVFVFSVCLALFMVSCSGNGDKVLSELQDLYGMESAEAGEYLKSKGFESFDDGHIFYRVDDYRVENIIFDEKRGEILSQIPPEIVLWTEGQAGRGGGLWFGMNGKAFMKPTISSCIFIPCLWWETNTMQKIFCRRHL